MVSAGLYQGVPPSAVPQTRCCLLKTSQMQILRGLDFCCESLYVLGGFLCFGLGFFPFHVLKMLLGGSHCISDILRFPVSIRENVT